MTTATGDCAVFLRVHYGSDDFQLPSGTLHTAPIDRPGEPNVKLRRPPDRRETITIDLPGHAR